MKAHYLSKLAVLSGLITLVLLFGYLILNFSAVTQRFQPAVAGNFTQPLIGTPANVEDNIIGTPEPGPTASGYDDLRITPTIPLETTTQPEPSHPCVDRARQHYAQTMGVSESDVLVGQRFTQQDGALVGDNAFMEFTLPLSGRSVCIVTARVPSGPVQTYAITEDGTVTTRQALEEEEQTLLIERCGTDKIELRLCLHMETERDKTQAIAIIVWHTNEDVAALTQAIEALGGEVGFVSQLAPMLSVRVRLDRVLQVAELPSVVGIHWAEGGTITPQLASSGGTGRFAPVWQLGYTGSGVRVGVFEDSAIDFSHPALSHANGGSCGTPSATPSQPNHATNVAGVIAANSPSLEGLAPNATLVGIYATFDPVNAFSDAFTALECAALEEDVEIINASFNLDIPVGTVDFYLNHYFDHLVWNYGISVVVSAGNQYGGLVTAPGSAWNVITVGALDDRSNTAWHDDILWQSSSDPTKGTAWVLPHRTKPEVMASGANIDTTFPVGVSPNPISGTSLAAPQVASLAALLLEQLKTTATPNIIGRPELLKAIILASALHDIEPGTEKDGLGGIDAALAMTIAQQGWFVAETVSEANFSLTLEGEYQEYQRPYSANLVRGEKVRLVLVYNSHSEFNPLFSFVANNLQSNLDLKIISPSGGIVADIYRYSEPLEYLEFIAPETGTYSFIVVKSSWDIGNTEERIALAWSRDATYLPELYNQAGWTSVITLRNNGTMTANVTVDYFVAGLPLHNTRDTCELAPNQICNIHVDILNRIPAGNTGWAVVGGGSSISTVVHTNKSTNETGYAYSGISSKLVTGGVQMARTIELPVIYTSSSVTQLFRVFLPLFYRAQSAFYITGEPASAGLASWPLPWQSSISVQNTTGQNNYVALHLYDPTGNLVDITGATLAAGESQTF